MLKLNLKILKVSVSDLNQLYIQLTPNNSSPRFNSNQNQFPLDFLHTFTVILPTVTRTLDDSNLLLTRSN